MKSRWQMIGCVFGLLNVLAIAASAEQTRPLIISVPFSARQTPGYAGKTRVLLAGVEDKRLLADASYLGIAQTGLFNKQVPLLADRNVRELLEVAARDTLKLNGLLADAPESATLSLSIKLFSLGYTEETFAASEYGMAETLFLAKLTSLAAPDGEVPATRQILVRAFEVKKAGDVTKYAASLLQAVLQQGVARLLGSDTFSAYLEPDSAVLFRQSFTESEDLEKWLAKSAKKIAPDESFMSATVVDLSGFTTLRLGQVKILDQKYKDRAVMAEKELRQELYAMLMGKLSKKFDAIVSGETESGAGSVDLSFVVNEYVPYRPGTQASMAFLFGIAGAAAGHGHLKGTMILKDGSTGATLVEMPFESKAGLSSSEAMLERLAVSVESYMQRTKADSSAPTLEVSWAKG
jgi:hypothetical protein